MSTKISIKNLPYINKYVVFLILISFAFFLGIYDYISDTRFTVRDDMIFSITDYKYWQHAAMAQGRFAFYVNGFFALIPYYFDNFIYFKFTQALALFLTILSLGYMFSEIIKSKYIGYIYALLLCLTWQITDNHNFLVSYPVYFAVEVIMFAFSSVAFVHYLHSGKLSNLFLSLLLWAVVLKGGEFWVLYTPFFFLLALPIASGDKLSLLRLAFKLLSLCRWHILVVCLSTLLYFVYRAQFPSSYDGNSLLNLNVGDVFYSMYILSTGLLPGYRFFVLSFSHDVEYIKQYISILTFIVSVGLFVVLYLSRLAFNSKRQTKAWYIVAFLSLIYFIFAPNLLVALTEKYQYWVYKLGITDYLYTAYSFFAMIAFAALILSFLSSRKYLYIAFCFLLAVAAGLTQINNAIVAESHAQSSLRFKLFDAFLDSRFFNELPENSLVSSESIYAGDVKIDKDYWTNVVKFKKSKSVAIVEEAVGSNFLVYAESSNDTPSFILFGERGGEAFISVDDKHCHDRFPCYILYNQFYNSTNHEFDLIGNDNNLYLASDSTVVRVDRLSKAYSKDGVKTYPLPPNVDDANFIALSGSNPRLYLKPSIKTDFSGAVYGVERSGESSWRWAYGDMQVNIVSKFSGKAHINLIIAPVNTGTLSISTNSEQLDIPFETEKQISLMIDLVEGENLITINSTIPTKRLSEVDTRIFGYMIRSMTLGMDKGVL